MDTHWSVDVLVPVCGAGGSSPSGGGAGEGRDAPGQRPVDHAGGVGTVDSFHLGPGLPPSDPKTRRGQHEQQWSR